MTGLQTTRNAILALLALFMLAAEADDDCDAPVADWQPRSAVDALVKRNGWQMARLKIDDGCYEIEARDADGYRIKAKLDPATLEIVSLKREHQSRDRDRAGQRDAAPPPGDLPKLQREPEID